MPLYVFKFQLAKVIMPAYTPRAQRHITTLLEAMMQVPLTILEANMTLEVTTIQDIITIQDTITQVGTLRIMPL
jgi:hypothetical protein